MVNQHKLLYECGRQIIPEPQQNCYWEWEEESFKVGQLERVKGML
jgi:hypothetical protein